MAQFEEITIDQGADFEMNLIIRQQNNAIKDLTGYSVAGQLRPTYLSGDSDAVTFGTEITDAFLGLVTVSLTDTQTATMNHLTTYVYDVETTDSDGIVKRIVQGVATINPSVTRL